MPYRYRENLASADAAFEAWGTTMEELFLAAAQATLGVMVEQPETLISAEVIAFSLEGDDLELLLFDYLQEIIYCKDARKLLITVTDLHLELASVPYRLTARGTGTSLFTGGLRLLTDVKAVTLYRFCLVKEPTGWRATVVLDV